MCVCVCVCGCGCGCVCVLCVCLFVFLFVFLVVCFFFRSESYSNLILHALYACFVFIVPPVEFDVDAFDEKKAPVEDVDSDDDYSYGGKADGKTFSDQELKKEPSNDVAGVYTIFRETGILLLLLLLLLSLLLLLLLFLLLYISLTPCRNSE